MKVEEFVEILGVDFYTGVPDSQLKALCNYLMYHFGIDEKHHVIAANEGNCTALAAGYHLATGKVPVVYMQNSGEGNIINPVASLLNDKVYAIPVIFVVGWRGEPGVHDEPQHIYQGQVTLQLLEDMDIRTFVVSKETTKEELIKVMKEYQLLISTTGKASRELFEIREENKDGHACDFLTVGSMGHASSIALGVALNKPNKKIWCIDGDGAALMHMGAMAVIGTSSPQNFIHVVINNGAHETVGGMPTVASSIDFVMIAKGCGYKNAVSVDNFEDLDLELIKARKKNELCFIEVKAILGARDNLGRPTTSAIENKENFMSWLTS